MLREDAKMQRNEIVLRVLTVADTCYGPISSVQFSSVAQSCPTLCDPTD